MPASKRKLPPSPAKTPKKKRRLSAVTRSGKLRSNFVIGNHDARTDYVAKPKKYNKSMKNFQNKVMKVLYKRDPKILKIQTVANATTVVPSATNSTEQAWQIFHMRPWNGSAAVPGVGTLYNESAQNDLTDLMTELGATDVPSERWKVIRSEMDLTIQSAVGGVLEIYELVYLQKEQASIVDQASFQVVLTDAINNLQALGTSLSLNRRGVTPFDITSLVKFYGVKVIKKSVFLLQANGALNYRMTDYTHDTIDKLAMADASVGFCLPGTTRSALVVYKPAFASTDASIVAGCNKRYQIQLLRNNAEQDLGGRD